MDHKDLLNDVISGMTSNDNSDVVDNSIQLTLSTGETYLVDPDNFDWNAAVQNLAQIEENVSSFRNMVFGVINTTHDDENPEASEYIKNLINQLNEYLAGYQISVDYKAFNPNLTDVEIALLLLFDCNNVTRTMQHHITMFSMMSMLSPMLNSNPFEEADTEEEYSEGQYWKVSADITEGGVTISNAVVDYCSPDEIDIVDEDDGKLVVYVYETSKRDAINEATALFANHVGRTFEMTSDGFSSILTDDAKYSGLLDE